MLLNKDGKQVILNPTKEYSDRFLSQFREIKEPQTYRGHPFFKMEERVNIK